MKRIMLYGLAFLGACLNLVMAENLPDGLISTLQISKNGVYKLSYNQLVDMGLNYPEKVKIFGQQGKALNTFNAQPEASIIQEIPLYFDAGRDNIFNAGDFILFYAEGPYFTYFDKELGLIRQQTNPYSFNNRLFITEGENGLRIGSEETGSLIPNQIVNDGIQVFHYESELHNLAQMGTTWYGELLDSTSNTFAIPAIFEQITADKKVKGIIEYVVHSNQEGAMEINAGTTNYQIPYNKNSSVYNHGYVYNSVIDFTIPNNEALVQMILSNANAETKSWLNYLTLNATCNLVYADTPLTIYNSLCCGTNQITQFEINSNRDLMVWNISNPMVPVAMETALSEAKLRFNAKTDSLVPFIAFNPDDALNVENFSILNYKTLNDFTACDLLIITHPDLIEAANNLALYRETKDNLLVKVISVNDILNNYAAGKPDPSAIYNYVRQQYNTSNLKYLLLMGTPSYDYRNVDGNNIALVPHWMSENSLVETASYASDDYYGYLNDTNFTGTLDIGIGRIPAKTLAEAQNYVDKIINYESTKSFGSWKNQTTFIADDEDGSIHLSQSEALANDILENNFDMNQNKIYFADLEEQVDSVLNDTLYQYIYSYPEAETKIANTITNGALVINYTGHGAPGLWAHEKVFSTDDFSDIQNQNNLPFMLDFACEFARTDNTTLNQNGSDLLFFENGGAIGLLAANRVSYSGGNFELASNTFNILYQKGLRLGDVFKQAKNNTSGSSNKLTFALLADPTLKLAIPTLQVKTVQLNGHAVNESLDTLTQDGIINLEGEIINTDGVLQNQFNGKVEINLYNYGIADTTLANIGLENPIPFNRQGSLIAQQSVDVINGTFEVTFDFTQSKYTPEDLHGKLSYYAYSDTEDASGSFEGFVVNGFVNGNPDEEVLLNRVFPNPVKSQAIFEFSEMGTYQLLLTDITGKIVKAQKVVNTNRIAFLRNQLKAGVYFYQVINDTGKRTSGKLIFN
jgi:hypothetical protein